MIPVLDWARFATGTDRAGFVRDLGHACRDTGFFLVTGHGIPQSLIDDTFAAADAFFAQPDAVKAQADIRNSKNNRGWSAEGTENLDDSKPDQTDRKEAFNIGLELSADDPRVSEPFRGPNLWPDLPGFRGTALAYFDAVHRLGIDLHRPIALDLGLDEHYFAPFLDSPLATLRMLRYPGGTAEPGKIGAGAHTDYGSITLLMGDGEPGLQVQPRGKDWIDVPHVPGAFIVNIADCLMRWTNDVYVSTPHRVQIPKNPRRSMAFFLDPNPDAVIEALPGTGAAKYPPVTGAEYLKMRLDATYAEKVTM
ncbi:isopenicillin N synthase family oxygenase [Alphaproteobacteria bacterium GH1-50]|uniref:2-oxoglutarate-dependent ethylene/succinate-forming enzyme n=1 Tax=Kangsaoukella pontilimi TaxID=2691042 RepID=A0A7C9MC23_9RHOB|nr:2-oxoglutarate and iron-dependent oxygenase domain-containing protein [Kangsaoukella pontilimi]MXQ09093.1 isopenicillin N synthase family oxygenase [Kangsaoukella pontilimi]